MSTQITEATTAELMKGALDAGQAIKGGIAALDMIVPEVFARTAQPAPELDLEMVVAWLERATEDELAAVAATVKGLEYEPTVPAVPKPPTPEVPSEGRDRVREVEITRTVVLENGDDAAACKAKLGDELRGTRVIVKGTVGPLIIGGHNPNDLHLGAVDEGSGCEIIGEEGTAPMIRGVKLSNADAPVQGQLHLARLAVTPEWGPGGKSQGDYAAIRSLTGMPELHLVLEDIEATAPKSWVGYDGFRMKWNAWLKEMRLTILGFRGLSPREHTLYAHSIHDAYVEAVENVVQFIRGSDGVMRPLGNGRTLLQFVARVPQVTIPGGPFLPKGGTPSVGRIVAKDCTARATGWEGLTANINETGQLVGETYGRGGGAAFTVANHTGELARFEGCRTEGVYANSLAVYSDYGAPNKTAQNPEGYRGWMIDPETLEVFNPLEVLEWQPAFATRRLELDGFDVGRVGSRTPMLAAGVREIVHRGIKIAGEPTYPGGSGFDVDYQQGLASVENITKLA